MNRSIITIALVLLGSWPVVAAEAEVLVRLRTTAVLHGDASVKLGNVAEIVTHDAALRNRIAQLDLESFQGLRTSATVSQEQVQIRLALAGIPAESLRVSGAATTAIRWLNDNEAHAWIADRLHAEFSAWHQIPSEELHLEILGRPTLPADLHLESLRLIMEPGAELRLGQCSLETEFTDGNGSMKRFRVPVTVGVVRSVARTRRQIAAGQVINAEDIEAIDWPQTTNRLLYQPLDWVVGKPAARDIAPFSMIKSSDLQRDAHQYNKPVMARRSLVNVIFQQGNLHLTLRNARALTSGNPGDRVEWLNPKSGKRMAGVVVDEKTIQMQ